MYNYEYGPSIRVYREVQPQDQQWLKAAREIIDASGIECVELSKDLRSTIISPSEVRNLHNQNGIWLTEDKAEELANYLHEELPPTITEELEDVATAPWSYNKPRRAGKDKKVSLTIATVNPVVEAERLAGKKLINKFSELPKSLIQTWPRNPHVSQVHIAKFSGPYQAQNLKLFAGKLLEANIVPETMGFEDAITEDV